MTFQQLNIINSHRLKEVEYIEEAQGDLKTAVVQLLDGDHLYGLSKWSSLQAVEKFLKAYLKKKSVEPQRTHNLEKLAHKACSLELSRTCLNELDKIQCQVNVRYDSSQVKASEALDAYYAEIASDIIM